ncbi:hypothetical protein ACFWDQ_15685 [Streptomyces sp. NPDC060053]|uniref:hypothetical protein n=1 Tax=Streptomyces sp. NPDC060053 TaxID=3347047 RepID=UPI0036BCFD50
MNVTTTANVPQDRRVPTLVMACVGVFVAYLPVTTVSASLPAIQRRWSPAPWANPGCSAGLGELAS